MDIKPGIEVSHLINLILFTSFYGIVAFKLYYQWRGPITGLMMLIYIMTEFALFIASSSFVKYKTPYPMFDNPFYVYFINLIGVLSIFAHIATAYFYTSGFLTLFYIKYVILACDRNFT